MAEQFGKSYTRKAKPTYFSAILGVALVLFLLGALGWVFLNAGQLSKNMKEKVELQVILRDMTRDSMAMQLKTITDQQPFAAGSEFITKDAAAQRFKQEFGEDFIDVLGGVNPLFSSINVKLHSEYVNKDSLARIEQFYQQSNIVREVSYPGSLVQVMNDNIKRIGITLLVLAGLLLVSVIFLIDNTVRLAMFSNRFLIKTMQMVGATRWFIAKPFDTRALINGLISGIIAVAALIAVKVGAESFIPELKTIQSGVWNILLYAGIITLGICISLLSTHRSVTKYLKLQLDDLY
jgi:cell division transport system permease protein